MNLKKKMEKIEAILRKDDPALLVVNPKTAPDKSWVEFEVEDEDKLKPLGTVLNDDTLAAVLRCFQNVDSYHIGATREGNMYIAVYAKRGEIIK